MHNLTVHARIYSFPVERETDAAREVRRANQAFCSTQAGEIRQTWRIAYQEHIGQAVEVLRGSLGTAKAAGERQLDFLRELADNPPTCDINNVDALESADAARQALKPPYSSLPREQRRSMWANPGSPGDANTPRRRPRLMKSHLASVLEASSKVVDLRYVITR